VNNDEKLQKCAKAFEKPQDIQYHIVMLRIYCLIFLDIFLAVAYDTSIDRQRRVSVQALKHRGVPESPVMRSFQ
jgi:hypothetical protein